MMTQINYIFEDGDEGKGDLISKMERCRRPSPVFRPSRDLLNNRGELQKAVVQLQGADFAAYELNKFRKDDPAEQWPISKYRKSLVALSRTPCEWGRWSEADLIAMCEKRTQRRTP